MTDPLNPQLAPSPQTDDVLLGVADGVGYLQLNRPQAINALSTEMCRAIDAALALWADDETIARVELSGTGTRGLCSGGDVRAVRQAVVDGDRERGVEFFRTEYAMNARIASYPKPYKAIMQGITMGGGLGVSALALHYVGHAEGGQRLVAHDVQIAMPESIIGFFPDVGISWLLARAPRELGLHMALTGCTINAADAIAIGLADGAIPGEELPAPSLPYDSWTQECYAGDDPAEMIARLETHANPVAREAAKAIRQRSPLSVCVAVRAIRETAHLSVEQTLARDLVLATNFTAEPDFLEGVRAQLVDKDRSPGWRHARIEDVPAADVEALFTWQ